MYNLAGYGYMIEDRVRVDAYTQAMRQAIRPGSVVLEIGTGPGIFAVLACKLGAKRVYAIEPDDIIQLAREIAAANGCSDKIELIQNISTKVTLPERAGVIVSDLRGILPLLTHHIPSIIDARKRLLAPGGTLIPKKDTLWAAVVEAPKPYGSLAAPWEQNAFGQDLSPARRLAVNTFTKRRVSPEQLLTPPQPWTTLEYSTIENADVRNELHWSVTNAGTGHGILVWFDAEIAQGISFSTGPFAPETIYGSMFFPWMNPVALSPASTCT